MTVRRVAVSFNKMVNFVKRHWLLILLAFLAAVLGFAWFVVRVKPPEEPLPPPKKIEPTFRQPESRFSEPLPGGIFTITAPLPALPDKIEVFGIERLNARSAPQRLAAVFSDLGISPATSPRETSLGSLIWENEDSSLLVKPDGRFSFSGELKIVQVFSASSARVFATQTVSDWELVGGVSPSRVRGFVVEGNHLIESTNLNNAEVFSVFLQPIIGSLTVVGPDKGQELIEFRVTSDGKITFVDFDLQIPSVSQGDFPIKSWQEATSDLNNGRGQTLWITDEAGNPAPPLEQEPLKSATMTRAFLAYFDSGDEQTVYQPVFVFEGTGETVNTDKRTLAVFVPAVK